MSVKPVGQFAMAPVILDRVLAEHRPFIAKIIETGSVKLAGQLTGIGGKYPQMLWARLVRDYGPAELKAPRKERKRQEIFRMTEKKAYRLMEHIAEKSPSPNTALKALGEILKAQNRDPESMAKGNVYAGPRIVIHLHATKEEVEAFMNGGKFHDQQENEIIVTS